MEQIHIGKFHPDTVRLEFFGSMTTVNMMETKEIYNRLIQSLKLVSSPYETQVVLFPDYVSVADEIALIYNDSYVMLPQINGLIPSHIEKMLDELDILFEDMSRDKSLWNIESLKQNEYWAKSRELGSRILVELTERQTKPNFDYIHWVDCPR